MGRYNNYITIPDQVPEYSDEYFTNQLTNEVTEYLNGLNPQQQSSLYKTIGTGNTIYSSEDTVQAESDFFSKFGNRSNKDEIWNIAKNVLNSRQQGDYNNSLAYARKEIDDFQRAKKREIENAFSQQIFDFYFTNDPEGKGKQFPGLAPDMSSLNQQVQEFAAQIKNKYIGENTPESISNPLSSQLDHEISGLSRNLTSHQMNNEVQFYKNSYADQGKGLLQKMETSPSLNYQDITSEYYNSLASGVNQGLITPEEGQARAISFSNDAKKLRKSQIDQSISPVAEMNPVQNVQKADMIIKDNVSQGVLTPQEAYNLLGESKSRALAVESTKNLDYQKSMVASATNVAVEVKNQDERKAVVLQTLKKGMTPTAGNFEELYKYSNKKDRDKLDAELHQSFQVGKFSVLPPSIRQELLNDPEMAAATLGIKSEKEFKSLEEHHKSLLKEAEDDPVSLVLNQKLVDGVVPIDYSNNDALMTSLTNRSYLSDKVYAQTGVENTGMTDKELVDLGNKYVNAQVTEKRDLLGSIAIAYGDKADRVFKKLDEKGHKELGLVGSYYSSGNEETALDIMNGIEAIKANKNLVPQKVYEQAVDTYKGDLPVYLDDASTGETKNRVLQASKYIYASSLRKQGVIASEKDSLDDGIMKSSVLQAAGGGTLSLGKSDRVEMPYKGVTSDDIYKQMDKLSLGDVDYIKQISDRNFKSDDDLHKFLKDDLIWVSLGGGEYFIYQSLPASLDGPGGGQMEIMVNKNTGEPVKINLRKFMKGNSYTDPSKAVGVMPQYVDVFKQMSQSEAEAEGWKNVMDQHDKYEAEQLRLKQEQDATTPYVFGANDSQSEPTANDLQQEYNRKYGSEEEQAKLIRDIQQESTSAKDYARIQKHYNDVRKSTGTKTTTTSTKIKGKN